MSKKRMSTGLRQATVACSRLSNRDSLTLFGMLCHVGGFEGDSAAEQFASLLKLWSYPIPRALR